MKPFIDAYRTNPDAVVGTSYSTAETAEVKQEDLNVRELLETHLSTAEELGADDDQ